MIAADDPRSEDQTSKTFERLSIDSGDLSTRVRKLLLDSTVQRIVVRNAQEVGVVEVPLVLGPSTALTAQIMAAMASLTVIARSWTVDVYREASDGRR